MQPGGRFVQQEQRAARGSSREKRRQFQSLGLSARERRGGLAEWQVVEANVTERLQSASDPVFAPEITESLVDGHFEHVGDRSAAVGHFQHLAAESPSSTLGAGCADVGQELHVDFDLAGAAAHVTTTASGGVETELPGRVAPLLGFGRSCEQAADVVERLEVGGGDRPGRSADR